MSRSIQPLVAGRFALRSIAASAFNDDPEAADRDAENLPVTGEWIAKCIRGHGWLHD